MPYPQAFPQNMPVYPQKLKLKIANKAKTHKLPEIKIRGKKLRAKSAKNGQIKRKTKKKTHKIGRINGTHYITQCKNFHREKYELEGITKGIYIKKRFA